MTVGFSKITVSRFVSVEISDIKAHIIIQDTQSLVGCGSFTGHADALRSYPQTKQNQDTNVECRLVV